MEDRSLKSLVEFLEHAMKQDGYELMPYQRELLRLAEQNKKKPFFVRMGRSNFADKQLQWKIKLFALRQCWEMGETTTLLCMEQCSVRRPEPMIFDDFVYIDR